MKEFVWWSLARSIKVYWSSGSVLKNYGIILPSLVFLSGIHF